MSSHGGFPRGEVEPGWYPDPAGEAEQRYWDGSQWTERVRTAGRQAPGDEQQQLERREREEKARVEQEREAQERQLKEQQQREREQEEDESRRQESEARERERSRREQLQREEAWAPQSAPRPEPTAPPFQAQEPTAPTLQPQVQIPVPPPDEYGGRPRSSIPRRLSALAVIAITLAVVTLIADAVLVKYKQFGSGTKGLFPGGETGSDVFNLLLIGVLAAAGIACLIERSRRTAFALLVGASLFAGWDALTAFAFVLYDKSFDYSPGPAAWIETIAGFSAAAVAVLCARLIVLHQPPRPPPQIQARLRMLVLPAGLGAAAILAINLLPYVSYQGTVVSRWQDRFTVNDVIAVAMALAVVACALGVAVRRSRGWTAALTIAAFSWFAWNWAFPGYVGSSGHPSLKIGLFVETLCFLGVLACTLVAASAAGLTSRSRRS